MAAPTVNLPARVYKTVLSTTGTPQARRLLEKATQTFKQGVPVVVDSTGYLIESPTIASALKIAGFSQESASNLTTSGVPKVLSLVQKPQNQPNALIIPGGAPPNDGRCGVNIADENSQFILPCDLAHTPAVTDVGLIYGLTKDGTTGQWYIDSSITAAGSGAIVEITEIPAITGDPLAPPTPIPGGLMVFRVTSAGQQFGV